MSRVVYIENCNNCRECVEVCPVACFHEIDTHVVISVDECIDCSLCEEACQSAAILNEDSPKKDTYASYLAINKELSELFPKVVL